MPRVLLLLPSATYRAPDFLDAAARVGAEVVVGSDVRQTMAEAMGDRALVVPFDDPAAAADAIVDLARRSPLSAVVAVDDQGVLAAAEAAARLGLAHNPPGAVAATRDKARLRAVLTGAGLRQPAFRVVPAGADAGAAAAEVGLPCVVKALSLAASRGVIRADDTAAARAAAERVRAIAACEEDPAPSVLVESYVPGVEVAVEALLRGGGLEPLAIFDKPDPLEGPYFEETIYVTPSRLPSGVQDGLAATAAAACAALGLTEGPVHAELRLPPDGGDPVLLEVAGRSIGGLCSRALRFGAGISLEEVILRHALGQPLDDVSRAGRASGVMMIPIPGAGMLEEVAGVDAARAVPGVAGVEITIAKGRPVQPLPEGDRYLGFVFATGDTPEAVEAALRDAHARLRIRIT